MGLAGLDITQVIRFFIITDHSFSFRSKKDKKRSRSRDRKEKKKDKKSREKRESKEKGSGKVTRDYDEEEKGFHSASDHEMKSPKRPDSDFGSPGHRPVDMDTSD